MRNSERHALRKENRSGQARSVRKKNSSPQTLEEYLTMAERSKDRWNRAVHVVSKMRNDKLSLESASRYFEINPRTVTRLAGSALRKNANGKFAAKATDKLLRVLVILTNEGLQETAVRDSRESSLLGRYWAAVEKYLETGDESALRKIRRKTITDAGGKRIRLIKDIAELERLGSAGVLFFESLYGKAA